MTAFRSDVLDFLLGAVGEVARVLLVGHDDCGLFDSWAYESDCDCIDCNVT